TTDLPPVELMDPAPIQLDVQDLSDCFEVDLNDAITSSMEGVTISFYETEEDAVNGESPIDSWVTQSGTYYIRAQTSDDCFVVKATNVIILEAHMVSAGPDQEACASKELVFQLMGSVEGDYEKVLWTTDGEGIIGNADQLEASYTPSVKEKKLGKKVLLTLTVKGECGEASDDMFVKILKKPLVLLKKYEEVCVGEKEKIPLFAVIEGPYDHLLWETSGQGEIFRANEPFAVYRPTKEEQKTGKKISFTITVENECGKVVKDKVIQIIPDTDLIVKTGPNQEFCVASDEEIKVTLSGKVSGNYEGLKWVTNGNGTLKNADQLQAMYFPSKGELKKGAKIKFKLKAWNKCSEVMDELKVIINVLPKVKITSAPIGCVEPWLKVPLSAHVIGDYYKSKWTTNGKGKIKNPHQLNTVYIPTEEELIHGAVITVQLKVFSDCGIVQKVKKIIIESKPVVWLGPDQKACASKDLKFVINAKIKEEYNHLKWTTDGKGHLEIKGERTAIYWPTKEEKAKGALVRVTLTTTSDCGSVHDVVKLKIIKSPELFIGGVTEVCVFPGMKIPLHGTTNGEFDEHQWTHNGKGNLKSKGGLKVEYEPSEEEMTTGATLKFCLTVKFKCTTLKVYKVVKIIPQPIVLAESDMKLCLENDENVPLKAVVKGPHQGIMWTSSGEGQILNASQQQAVYVPTVRERKHGAYLTFVVKVKGACGVKYDKVNVWIKKKQDVKIVKDIYLCAYPAMAVSLKHITGDKLQDGWWEHNGKGSITNGTNWNGEYIPTKDEVEKGCTITFKLKSDKACGKVVLIVKIHIIPAKGYYYLNAGGPKVSDEKGTIFQQDDFHSGGSSTSFLEKGEGPVGDNPLFLSHRSGKDFKYRFPVNCGKRFRVVLKFLEDKYDSKGKRLMHVEAQGISILRDLDIIQEAGAINKPIEKAFEVEATDGFIDLRFYQTKGSIAPAVVSAIMILPLNEIDIESDYLLSEQVFSSSDEVLLYPNPSMNDQFTLDLPISVTGQLSIKLTNLQGFSQEIDQGQINRNQNKVGVDLRPYGLVKGFYIVELKVNGLNFKTM
ncbi:malectin domain-containing carbohydrate-binding protein, partial [Xanthovirga aplysinae]|uniref:malectin domain-containing carbohydrate-binding protein n=1 Tax=Xanthovirga aplysinae TaxID=2529853 RepID=UPI001CA45B7C